MLLDAKDIVEWIKEYADLARKDTLIIGISGGVDSSLVSTLCAETGLKTIVVKMPIDQLEEQNNLSNAHASWLLEKYSANVICRSKDLSSVFHQFCDGLTAEESSNLGLANTRSRLRMMMLYQLASTSNGLVVGTGNKVEDFGIGFFTKYGDGGVDISPIADLYKTEVRQMASSLGILQSIIDAAPTDGLWDDGRTDEDQIGATYEELEWAMEYAEGDPLDDRKKEVLEIYRGFHTANKHKMVAIPIFKGS